MITNTHSEQGVLAVNGGSSSLRFALFRPGEPLTRVLTGKFDRVGLPKATLSVTDVATGRKSQRELELRDHAACVPPLWQLLADESEISVRVISHRIVHGGMRFREPQPVTLELIAELRRIRLFAPQHLPAQIALLEEIALHYPGVLQVACFDTAFHRDMPRVAKLMPIPRRYEEQGVQRYGFHGLSYTYLMQELERVVGATAASGRVILAHLGNGASMAAVLGGRSLDTTMGFTPAAGLVMSTRTGDIDPGLVSYLARSEGMTADQFNEMANAKSGLLGVSEISSDVRELLAREKDDVRAAEALALFCYQARKWIGALAAVLNGLDTLVFSAGIGENAPVIRARICGGLGFLGLELDASANEANAPIISQVGSKVTVRVIPTDEELCLARAGIALMQSEAVPFSPPQTHRKGIIL
ncbi:MAG: ackA [Pedosphaera sp.]|nr:ackA [Pedosphaera sp.]